MLRLWITNSHVCVFYRSGAELRQLLMIHYLSGLERGERIMYFTDDSSGPAWLSSAAPEFDLVVKRGQVDIRTLESCVDRNGTLDSNRMAWVLSEAADLAAQEGYLGLRASVEMTSQPPAPAIEAVLGHEQQLSARLSDRLLADLKLICQYDQLALTQRHLIELPPAHELALTTEQALQSEPLLRIAPLRTHPGLRLSGDIDQSNIDELAVALESIIEQGYDDIHLDVADLHYADVAAVRLLADLAGDRISRRVSLYAPTPIVRTILRIYGWDKLPALRLAEERECR